MPAGLALKRALGSIDVRLIDPGEISICKREDGSDWLPLEFLLPPAPVLRECCCRLAVNAHTDLDTPSSCIKAMSSGGSSELPYCPLQAYKGLWSGKDVAVKQLVSCSPCIPH